MASDRNTAAAISAFERPRATCSRTSTSRSVSADSAALPLAGRWPGHRLLDESTGDARVEQRVTGGDGADGGHELFGRGGLEQVAACAGPQRRVDLGVSAEGGQHQHLRVDGQPFDGGDAVEVGHAQVHQDDVGV